MNFTDQSTGADGLELELRRRRDLHAENPSHTFTTVGTYTVSLTVTNGRAAPDHWLDHGERAAAGGELLGTPTNGPAPLPVQFTDASTNSPTSWSWSFGDGATSTQQNPRTPIPRLATIR